MGPEIEDKTDHSSPLYIELDKARQQGYTDIITIQSPEGRITIAFNEKHTGAKVYRQLEDGSLIPQGEPCKIFGSKSKPLGQR